MSSSAITNIIIQGPTGPVGPIGFIGQTGPTGATGATGGTGARGRYLTSLEFSDSGNIVTAVYLDDQNSENTTTQTISGSFMGNTFVDQTTGVVLGSSSGVSGTIGVFLTVGGGTFNLRGICAYGTLRASLTGAFNEYISIDSIYYGTDVIGNLSPGTFTSNNMTYLGAPTTVHGAKLKFDTDVGTQGLCGTYDFLRSSNPDVTFHLNSGARIKTLGPIKKNAVSGLTSNSVLDGSLGTTFGMFIDANTGGAFILKTPIGIRGISGSFKVNEIASLTLLIDSDDVWNFPSNVLFEENENYLSCGKNIIGLFTYDGGVTWKARVSHRGHGIENNGTVIGPNGLGVSLDSECIPGYLYGSCCYKNTDETLECLDYTTRGVCDRLFGNFNPGIACERSCGIGNGICCTNGECLEGVSVSQCDLFGGSYWSIDQCVSGGTFNNPQGELSTLQIETQGRFCYDPCGDPAVCCKDGICLGNYTRRQCELFLGGKSMTGSSCNDVNCFEVTGTPGACCKCFPTGVGHVCISDKTPAECKALSGLYIGPGTDCADSRCDCLCPDPIGACCYGEFRNLCLSNQTQAQCAARVNSTWKINQTCSGTTTCADVALGACCQDGDCVADGVIASTCTGIGNTFRPGVTCINASCPTPMGACCSGEFRNTCNFNTEAQCQSSGNSIWNINQPCSSFACGPHTLGSCCVNGVCISPQTSAQCGTAGGIFHPSTICSSNPCNNAPPVGICCSGIYGAACESNITQLICLQRENATWRVTDDTCISGVDIKSSCYSVALGACCVNGICTPNRSKLQCDSSSGIFHPGITCDSSLCDPIGACCHGQLSDQCVDGITAGRCISEFAGTFNVGEVCLDDPCDSGSLGSCCYIDQEQGLLCVQNTASQCALLDSWGFTPGAQCNIDSCSGLEVRACCREDAQNIPYCTTMLVSDCIERSGTPIMDNPACVSELCDIGACCFEGACFYAYNTRANCESLGGTPLNPPVFSPGYDCNVSTFTCPPMRGRCCFTRPGGIQECLIMSDVECTEFEGNWSQDVRCEDGPPCVYPEPYRACCHTEYINGVLRSVCEEMTELQCMIASINQTPGDWLNNAPQCFPGICECGSCCYYIGNSIPPRYIAEDPDCPISPNLQPPGVARMDWIADKDLHCAYTKRSSCELGGGMFTPGAQSCLHYELTSIPPIVIGPCFQEGCCTSSGGCDYGLEPPCGDGRCYEGSIIADPSEGCESAGCDPGCTILPGGACVCGGIPPGGGFFGDFLNNDPQESTNIPSNIPSITNMANFVNVAVNVGGNTYCVPMITTSPNVELCESSEIL